MSCKYLFVFLASIFFVSAAHAQFSVYGTAAISGYGYAYNSGKLIIDGDYAGYGGGATYLFSSDRRLKLGVDFRVYVTPAAHGGNTELGSFRVSFVPRKVPLRPYFQIGAGSVSAKVVEAIGPQSVTMFGIGLGAGLDIPVSGHLDLRVLEIESAAGTSTDTSAGTASIGAGVVYHFRAP
jgi:hypothetical protein